MFFSFVIIFQFLNWQWTWPYFKSSPFFVCFYFLKFHNHFFVAENLTFLSYQTEKFLDFAKMEMEGKFFHFLLFPIFEVGDRQWLVGHSSHVVAFVGRLLLTTRRICRFYIRYRDFGTSVRRRESKDTHTGGKHKQKEKKKKYYFQSFSWIEFCGQFVNRVETSWEPPGETIDIPQTTTTTTTTIRLRWCYNWSNRADRLSHMVEVKVPPPLRHTHIQQRNFHLLKSFEREDPFSLTRGWLAIVKMGTLFGPSFSLCLHREL